MNLETITNNPILMDIVVIIIILIASFLIIKWTSIFIKNTGKKFEFDATLIQVLNEIIKYTIYAFAITIILNEIGINITAIAVSLGIVGIAVGFAARDTISNFIAGLFVLGDKSFKVGDIIEIADQKGKVLIMGFRVTKLVTPDNNIITIPNSNFSKNVHVNHTPLEEKRVDLDVTIPFEVELQDVINSFEELTSGFKWALDEPKANVVINELSDIGIRATMSVWVDDPWKVAEYRSIIAQKIGPLLVVNHEQN
jgi:small conductance mechanosensitive channel